MTEPEFILRPMTEKDLKTVLDWRNSDHVRLNMFNDSLIGWEEHRQWFSRISAREDSSYRIFEIGRRPVGLVNFADIDRKSQSSFWGFYLGEPDCPRGSGFVMGYLALEHAFTDLRMRKVSGECFASNAASIRFHERLGFRREGLFIEHMSRAGKYEDVIRFGLLDREWLSLKPQIKTKAFGSFVD
jgi:UDP-4-amino-4,6-dideoxy-N-acetyl-beta-L-altrosamine N-acetyltransferase